MGRTRRNTAKDDVVFKTMLQDLERLVRPEAVTDQNSWFLLCPRFGLGIEHTFKPLQADLEVDVSRFKARVMPFRS
jgi:hypothetical protein